MQAPSWTATVLGTTLLATASCTTQVGGAVGPAASTARLTATQFSDIPAPDGYVLERGPKNSYSYQSGEFRVGRLTYRGRSTPTDVRRYFLNRMPDHAWTLVDTADDAGDAVLTFAKRGTQAQIRIAEQSQEPGRPVVLTVEVTTTG